MLANILRIYGKCKKRKTKPVALGDAFDSWRTGFTFFYFPYFEKISPFLSDHNGGEEVERKIRDDAY